MNGFDVAIIAVIVIFSMIYALGVMFDMITAIEKDGIYYGWLLLVGLLIYIVFRLS